MEEILDKSKQSIKINKYEHSTGIINMTNLKPTGEANMYIQFGYDLQTIFYHTQWQFYVSMNADPTNSNK